MSAEAFAWERACPRPPEVAVLPSSAPRSVPERLFIMSRGFPSGQSQSPHYLGLEQCVRKDLASVSFVPVFLVLEMDWEMAPNNLGFLSWLLKVYQAESLTP